MANWLKVVLFLAGTFIGWFINVAFVGYLSRKRWERYGIRGEYRD